MAWPPQNRRWVLTAQTHQTPASHAQPAQCCQPSWSLCSTGCCWRWRRSRSIRSPKRPPLPPTPPRTPPSKFSEPSFFRRPRSYAPPQEMLCDEMRPALLHVLDYLLPPCLVIGVSVPPPTAGGP